MKGYDRIFSCGLRELSLEELGLKILDEYPLGSFTLTLFSGDAIDDIALFDGSINHIKIRESGEIDVVEVYNYSEKHIFVPHGVMISGVSQDRIIKRPSIVPPTREKALRLPAYCVEAGQGLIRVAFDDFLLAPLDFRAFILSSEVVQRDVWADIRRRFEDLSRIMGISEHVIRTICPAESMATYAHVAIYASNIFRNAVLSELSDTIKLINKAREVLGSIVKDFDRIEVEPKTERNPIGLWLKRIARLCVWGIEHFRDEEMPRIAILADLYGLLHAENRPRIDNLSPIEKIRLETILRRIVSVISKYTNISTEIISEHLRGPRKHYILARKTMNINIAGLLREILNIVSNVDIHREAYNEPEKEIENLRREISEIRRHVLRYLEEVEALYSRIIGIGNRIRKDIIQRLGKRICRPEYFGIRYREDIIGYSVSKNGKTICVEIMPTNITEKLWIEIFRSIILYIIVGGRGKTKRVLERPKTTKEKLDRYTLTIRETKNKIATEIQSNDRTVYYFEAYI
mgnify:CR=1 FL=1